MSRQAIAAVLARTDLASGERLVALSLASFAGRENRAWPGAPAASARAGLSRSRYQQARERLVTRGLVVVDERATGRGRASTVTLMFADTGPWWEGEINVELFETVLSYSPVRGPERLLLATMAALADEHGAVCDFSTSNCAPRPALPTGLTVEHGGRCSRRASSSWSAAPAAAATPTCGACAIRAQVVKRFPPAFRGASCHRRAHARSSRRHQTTPLPLSKRQPLRAKRGVRIGHFRRETVRS